MLELLVALIQASDIPAPPRPDTVVVTGKRPNDEPAAETLDMPTDDTASEYVAIWPTTAYQTHTDGRVMLRCLIDVHGLAEQCRVASETPTGQGFGAAALQMRPTFKLKPATGPNGPVSATMNVAVNFKAPRTNFDMTNGIFRGNALKMREVTMVSRPVWVAAPAFDEWTRAYPAAAHNAEGYTVVHCRVLVSGGLNGCEVVKEEPQSHGFGAAAATLAAEFRLDPALARAARTQSLWVDIPIRMAPPAVERTVNAPNWLMGVDPAAAPKLYPPEAAAKGVASGRGMALCQVSADGALAGCAPQEAASDSPGFADAAVKIASAMRMNLWSADGAPVIGGKVQVIVRLNLKDAVGS